MPVVSVQNLFNLTNRSSADVLAHCEAEGIGFIPWFPVASGALSGPDTAMGTVVAETGATPTQVALAWLLHHSPVILPIPGTKSVAHVEENCEAATLQLTDAQMAARRGRHPRRPAEGRRIRTADAALAGVAQRVPNTTGADLTPAMTGEAVRTTSPAAVIDPNRASSSSSRIRPSTPGQDGADAEVGAEPEGHVRDWGRGRRRTVAAVGPKASSSRLAEA